MGGSAGRMRSFAEVIAKEINHPVQTAEQLDIHRTDRYAFYKIGPVLSVSVSYLNFNSNFYRYCKSMGKTSFCLGVVYLHCSVCLSFTPEGGCFFSCFLSVLLSVVVILFVLSVSHFIHTAGECEMPALVWEF